MRQGTQVTSELLSSQWDGFGIFFYIFSVIALQKQEADKSWIWQDLCRQ